MPRPDLSTWHANGLTHPAKDAFAVTTSDDAEDNFATPARALYIGTSGNVAVVTLEGNAVTFSNVPVGILNVSAIRVNTTNTTASNIVGLV